MRRGRGLTESGGARWWRRLGVGVAVLALALLVGCTNPMGLDDPVEHTTSSGNHTVSSGNFSGR